MKRHIFWNLLELSFHKSPADKLTAKGAAL